MFTRSFAGLLAFFISGLGISAADPHHFPGNATFTTLITTPRAIEGLTGDGTRNLYTGGSGSAPCPIWQINLHSPSLPLPVVGNVPAAATPAGTCAFSGITFDAAGNLYQADGTAGRIYTFKPNSNSPPDATVYARGVPGTNGLAFDGNGNLWTGDGVTGLGRVWKITGSGANCTGPDPIVKCEEVFRIQPMRNGTALGGDISTIPTANQPTQGVGRSANTFPHTALGGNPQDLVANGIAFNHEGDMFVIDTARGALWKVQFDRHGNLQSPTGCDTTFTDNTLCLSNVFVAHPILEGGDGIALDRKENIWVDANERNAIAVVTEKGEVFEVFRNPVNAVGLRNSADASVGNNHILEFPTSPFLTGKVFCTAQSDGNRRDNFPRSEGEVNGGAVVDGTNKLGKISCMDQELKIPGLPLPVQ
jgi:sugar lactone lactonase YvrE